MTHSPLSAEDLLRDEPLDVIAAGGSIPDSLDLLNHRSTARRVAELAATATTHMNIAIFGPWGSGKSSFFGLLEKELAKLPEQPTALRFDAWKNAGDNFQANFLAEVGRQLDQNDVDERLFTSKRSVRLPFGLHRLDKTKRRRAVVATSLIGAAIVLGLPALWARIAMLSDPKLEFVPTFAANVLGFAGVAASGSLIFVLLGLLMTLTRVDVEESRPSSVAQFRQIFDSMLKKKRRYVVLVDELDRCDPDAVMDTLEGLRTFLGHDRCVFVVAFDRAAVAATIARHHRGGAPVEPSAPYYATSGEYLDKIFQFQISLPPQPRHVARRYALSLVADKGGIWAELRASGNQRLERVVNAVSPIHLRSPRRTKVLLNDFAVNARLYESMGFDWLGRSEEIAVWTAIQTEFPTLAREMEIEPRALDRNLEAARANDSAELIQPVDEVVAPEPSAEGASKFREGVALDLAAELGQYLRRLSESGYALPRQDLVLMHAGGDLLNFDDPAIYNMVLDVEGPARSDLTQALMDASDHDREGALRYLLEQREGAFFSESCLVRSLSPSEISTRLSSRASCLPGSPPPSSTPIRCPGICSVLWINRRCSRRHSPRRSTESTPTRFSEVSSLK
ncbi:P-loop NTPase fold protein [Schumannella sp. 10F1B-5-1]|uniref:KAP family P-loop NTPase fold protein n=1 Tax=Schumannella sp. 10F1B-5-1 TaxID=2590780 RepID=UPI001131FBC8|nr:P-loop NTPase fold protein [Schumannella sp. 10F1B-5-1]TPW78397.1 hypothetical protein FJ658_00900 [Schumannella sp. 10F1B-5-1]